MKRILDIYRNLVGWRGTAFNLLFLLLVIVFKHPLLDRFLGNEGSDVPDYLLGGLLLGALVLEIAGFVGKRPALGRSVIESASQMHGCASLLAFLMMIGHPALSFMIYLISYQVAWSKGDWLMQALGGLGFVLIFIREAVFIYLWIGPPKGGYHQRPGRLEMAGDVLGDLALLIFAFLVKVIIWDGIGLQSPLRASDPLDQAMELIGISIFFIMTLMPMNSLIYRQQFMARQTRLQRILFWASFIILVFSALSTFPHA